MTSERQNTYETEKEKEKNKVPIHSVEAQFVPHHDMVNYTGTRAPVLEPDEKMKIIAVSIQDFTPHVGDLIVTVHSMGK